MSLHHCTRKWKMLETSKNIWQLVEKALSLGCISLLNLSLISFPSTLALQHTSSARTASVFRMLALTKWLPVPLTENNICILTAITEDAKISKLCQSDPGAFGAAMSLIATFFAIMMHCWYMVVAKIIPAHGLLLLHARYFPLTFSSLHVLLYSTYWCKDLPTIVYSTNKIPSPSLL